MVPTKETPKPSDPSKEKVILDREELKRAAREERLVDYFTSKAALISDKKVQEMLRDSHMRDRILAIAQVLPSGAIRWMPEKAREFLKIAHAEIRAKEDENNAKYMSIEIETFVKNFQTFVETINEAEKLTEGGLALEAIDEMRDLLESVNVDSAALAETEKNLRDRFQLILAAAEKANTNADFVNALPDSIKKDPVLVETIRTIDADAGRAFKPEAISTLREKLVESLVIGLSDEQKKRVEAIRNTTDETLKELAKERERLIAGALEDGGKFRRLIGGADVKALINASMEAGEILDLEKLAAEYKAKRGPKEARDIPSIVTEFQGITGFKTSKEKLEAATRAKLILFLNKHLLNPFAILASSMEKDRTIDLEKLQMSLLLLGEEIEMSELQSRVGFTGDVLSGTLSETGEKNLIAFLEAKGIDNPAAVSIKQLLLRAGYPEPVITELEKAKYMPPMWVLGSISKLEKFDGMAGKFDSKFTRSLLVLAAEKELEDKVMEIKKDAFEDLFTFVFLKKDVTKTAKMEVEVKAARDAAKGKMNEDFLKGLKDVKDIERVKPLLNLEAGKPFEDKTANAILEVIHALTKEEAEAARKEAEKYWTELKAAGVIKDGTGGGFKLDLNQLVLDEYATNVDEALTNAEGKTNADFLKTLSEDIKNVEGLKPLLALDESKPFDPEKATEIKAKLAEMQKAQYNTKVIGGKSKEFHKAFKDAEVDDIPWDRSLKSTLKEGYELTLTTVDAWWKYMKTLPKIVYDPKLDPPLLKLVKQEQGHRMYRNVLQKALDRSKSAGVTMNTLLKKTEAAELARMKELSPIAATENPLEQLRRAQELLYVSAEIKEILGNEFPLSILPVDVQDRALWLAMHKGLDEAREYLSDDKKNFEKFLITDADKLEYQRFEGSKKNAAINSGRDVLTPLHQAGVHVLPHALDLLATLPHGKERVMLAVSSARVSRWMLDPAAAHPALNAILIVSPGLKGTAKDKAQAKRDAIVEAFCTQKDVPGVMTAAQATKFVQDVQKHLEFQNFDAQRSPALNEKKERFGNPLDILKAGGKELKKMLRSNNKVEKALAITMIVAAGFFLWQTWKKKGLGQKLMLGIPLFFGADILVKRMTGKGVLDRLGMRYMNEEDRSTSVEQFVRRNKKERNYAVLDTDPGRAAIQALMSTEKPIPVDCLLTWRKNSGAAPDYRTTAPEILQGAAQDVVAKMGSYTKSNTSPDANEQEAYRILYTAFDALCANVAADNVDVDASMTNPKAERGADLIERRYVLFNEDYMVVAGFDDELRAAANSRGGYTMLDVLVFERQTPAMKEAMYDNDELLEWMYRGTGVSLDFIRDGLTKGWVHTQILAEWGKRKGLLVLENGLSFASEKAKGFYEWLQVTYPKLTFQLKEDWLAAYNMVSGTLSSAGIYLKEYGDDAVEWTIDFSIATGKFTIDTAQNIHRELQKIGLTGEPIEWFDSICLSIFGFTMSEYILYKDSIEDTPAKRDAHVEALASDEKLFGLPAEGEKLAKKSDLEKQLEPISTGVNSVWIQTAFKDVTGDLFGDKEKDLDAYEKLAVNELLKRRMYSYMLARRVEEVQRLFESGVEGKELGALSIEFPEFKKLKENTLAKEIDASYGLNSLVFLGAEKTDLFGAYAEWVHSRPEGYVRSGFEFLDWALRIAPHRDNATEYLTAINQYHTDFMKEAAKAFDALPTEEKNKKLLAYEQYLQTVLTNAVIDATLRGQEATSAKVLPTDKIKFEAAENTPLALAIQRAKNFLEFLRVNRGASPDPKELGSEFPFEKFEIAKEDPKLLQEIVRNKDLMNLIRQVEPKIPQKGVPLLTFDLGAVGLKPNTLTATEVSSVNTGLAKDLTKDWLTPIEVKAMAEAIGSENFDAAITQSIRSKLEKNLTDLLKKAIDFSNENDRRPLYTYLRSVPDGAIRDKLETKMFEVYKEPVNSKLGLELAEERDKENRPEQKQRMQHFLNKLIVHRLDKVVEEMAKVSMANLTADKDKYDGWIEEMVKLYVMSNPEPDYASDTISEALEYALYRGKWKSSGGYAAYEQFLLNEGAKYTQRPLKAPDQLEYKHKLAYFSNKGSKQRMNRSDEGSGFGAPVLSNVRNARAGKSRLDHLANEYKVVIP